jgi:hypothetical protein
MVYRREDLQGELGDFDGCSTYVHPNVARLNPAIS